MAGSDSEVGGESDEVNIHDIPPPSNKPECAATSRVGWSVEEMEEMLPQFQIDLAKLLGCAPDEIRIMGVRKAELSSDE